jgi:alpha-1,6-mannosyltransferase
VNVLLTGDRRMAYTLVGVSIASTFGVFALTPVRNGPMRAAVLAIAFATLAAVLANPRWLATLTVRAVMITSLCVTAVAIVVPPLESRDVWSYAFYGRVVSEYGESPYSTVPDDHPDDAYYERVGAGWRDTPSMYGPAFTAVSAGIMTVAGENHHVTRLAFQLFTAAGFVATLVLLARVTGSAGAVAAIGLNPLIIYSVVNSAHYDMVIGLCILGAALLAARGRDLGAALLVAVSVTLKVTSGLAVPALIFWIWYRRGFARALAAASVIAATVLTTFALIGRTESFEALSGARGQLSRGSAWQMVRPGGWDRLFSFAQRAAEPLTPTFAAAAIIVTALLALWLAYTRRRDPTPALALGAALAAYLLAAAYVLPWYAVWALPVLALSWRSGLSVLVAVQSALWAVAYQYERGLPTGPANRVLWLLAVVTIAFNLVAIVALAVSGWRRERAARPANSEAPRSWAAWDSNPEPTG